MTSSQRLCILTSVLALGLTAAQQETWTSREWAYGEGPLGGVPLAPMNTHSKVPMAPALPEWEAALRKRLRQNALEKIDERRRWLSEKHSEGSTFRADKVHARWSLFTPYYPCMWTLDKHPRVDQRHDGGKWTCGLPELASANRSPEEKCVVYSFGSHDEISFERQTANLTKGHCEIFVFDPTSSEQATKAEPAITQFYNLGLSDATGLTALGNMMTFGEIVAKLGHLHIDVLKVDIEGSEFPVFENFKFSDFRIGMLLMEIHPARMMVEKVHAFMSQFEDAGFMLFSMEPVTKLDPSQVEVAFIHKDWTPYGWLN